MATLLPISQSGPAVNKTTGIQETVAAPGFTLEVLGSSFQDSDYFYTNSNATITESLEVPLNWPSDIDTVQALQVQLRYNMQTGSRVNSWSLSAQIVDSGGAALTDAVSIPNITTTTITNSGSLSFTGVNLTATAAVWTSARLRISFGIVKSMGGDTLIKYVYAAEVTGTYTKAVNAQSATVSVTADAVGSLDKTPLALELLETVSGTDSLTFTTPPGPGVTYLALAGNQNSATPPAVPSGWTSQQTAVSGATSALVASATTMAADPTVTWLSNGSRQVQGVAYGNGLWVAVGSNYSITTSSDGVTWTVRDFGDQPSYFRNVKYDNGLWVAVGDSGTILTSTDGINWTSQTSGTTNRLYAVAYGNGLWATVGSSGAIRTSPDGVTWTAQSSGTTNQLMGVAYDNGLWVVVGVGGTVLTSTDGTAWTAQTFGATSFLYGVAYGNGLWVAVGSGVIRTSPDAVTWTSRTAGTNFGIYAVVYANNLWVAVTQSGLIRTSATGTTWTTQVSNTKNSLWTVAYGGGVWLAPFSRFVENGSTRLGAVSSVDGLTWTPPDNSSTGNALYSLAYGNGVWVSGGTVGLIRVSADAKNWDEYFTSSTSNATSNCLAYNGALWVSVGSVGAIRTSTDATVWSNRTSGTTNDLNAVAFGNGLWVAVGDSGTILTSTDGINWTSQTSGTTNRLYAVAYGNGLWVVTPAAPDRMFTSPDGINWTLQTIPSSNTSRGVAYGNGLWVAVCFSGGIRTSPDGVTWTSRTSGTTNDLHAVAYANGLWMAVGFGVTLSSPDGVTWTPRTLPDKVALHAVAYADNKWLAVGDFGTETIPAPGPQTFTNATSSIGAVYRSANGEPLQIGAVTAAIGSGTTVTLPAATLTAPASGPFRIGFGWHNSTDVAFEDRPDLRARLRAAAATVSDTIAVYDSGGPEEQVP